MNRDPLFKVLTSADAAVSPPRLERELAAKLRARLRWRSRFIAVAASVVLAVIGGLSFWMLREAPAESVRNVAAPHERAPENAVSENNAKDELKSLFAAAERHASNAERLCEAERAEIRREQVRHVLSLPGALEELSAARDQAAATLVLYGDQRRKNAGDNQEAEQAYRCVVARFSASQSAAEARERLAAHE